MMTVVEGVQKVLTLARGADHDETLSTHCKGVQQQHICKPPPTHHWLATQLLQQLAAADHTHEIQCALSSFFG